MTRGQRGAGSIYRKTGWTTDADGNRMPYEYWQAARDVAAEDGSGRRKRITGSGPTKTEARSRLEENYRRWLAGEQPSRTARQRRRQTEKRNATVEQAADAWFQVRTAEGLSDVMLRKYQGYFRLHINPHIGRRRLADLDGSDLGLLLNQVLPAKRRDNGRPLLGPSARRNIYKALSAFLNWAVANDYITRSPLRSVRQPQVRAQVADITREMDAAKRLLDTLRNEGNRDYARWLFQFLGLRRAERLGLTWGCVEGLDTDTPTLVIRQQLARYAEPGRGWYLKDTTKGGEPRRIVMPEPFISALQAHKRQQDKERAGETWNPEPAFADLVFVQQNGRKYTLNRDNNDWAAVLRAHGITHYRGHLNRHITATLLAEQNPPVPMGTVQNILGHQSVAMTYYYARITLAQQAEPMRVFGKRLLASG